MTETDRLVAMIYAASPHTLDKFLSRYEECLAALEARQAGGPTSREADETAEIGDRLGGPA